MKGSGDCEFLHPISHMASEKWEVGLKREFPFLKYPTKVVKGRVTDDRQVGRNGQVKEERGSGHCACTQQSWLGDTICPFKASQLAVKKCGNGAWCAIISGTRCCWQLWCH